MAGGEEHFSYSEDAESCSIRRYLRVGGIEKLGNTAFGRSRAGIARTPEARRLIRLLSFFFPVTDAEIL
jgi:hypothetical protein